MLIELIGEVSFTHLPLLKKALLVFRWSSIIRLSTAYMINDVEKLKPRKPELPLNHIEVGSGDLIEVRFLEKIIYAGGPRRIRRDTGQLRFNGAALADLPVQIGTKPTEPNAPRPAHKATVLINSRSLSPDASEEEKKSKALIFRFDKKPPGELIFTDPGKVKEEHQDNPELGKLTIFHLKLIESLIVDGEDIREIIFVVPPEEQKG